MAGDVKVTLTLITAKFSSGLSKMAGRVLGWGRSMVRGFWRIGRSMMSSLFRGARWAVAGGAAALGALIYKSVSTAGAFEQIELQFQTLFKSAEKARAWVDDLRDLAIQLPVELEDLAKASRLMQVFSDGVLNTRDTLILLTDMASATNNEIESISFWVGRAYSMISAGRPFGEAAMRLQEMGLISGRTRNELEKLSKAGASSTKIWETLHGNFMAFSGAATVMSQTWKGRLNKLSDSWKKALADIGDEILVFAKGRVNLLAESFSALADSGWASYFGRNIREGLIIAEQAIIKFVQTSIPKVQAYAQKVKDAYAGIGTSFGASGGEGVAQVLSADISKALIKAVEFVAPHFFSIGIAVGKGVISGMRQGISEGLSGKMKEVDEWGRKMFPNFKKVADLWADRVYGNVSGTQGARILAQTANPLEAAPGVKFIQSQMNRDLERAVGKGIYSADSDRAFETLGTDVKANIAMQSSFLKRVGREYFKNNTLPGLSMQGYEIMKNKVQQVIVVNTEELKAPVKTQSRGGY